jgi:hypothetical protein
MMITTRTPFFFQLVWGCYTAYGLESLFFLFRSTADTVSFLGRCIRGMYFFSKACSSLSLPCIMRHGPFCLHFILTIRIHLHKAAIDISFYAKTMSLYDKMGNFSPIDHLLVGQDQLASFPACQESYTCIRHFCSIESPWETAFLLAALGFLPAG